MTYNEGIITGRSVPAARSPRAQAPPARAFTFNRSIGSFGKRELLLLIESGQPTFESLERRVESVRVYLTTAVAFGREEVKVWYKGEDISGSYRFTNTYVLDEGRWENVVTHSSRIIP